MGANYQQVVEIINDNESFLICSHAHPDGDGIGSTLALGLALGSMGKKVVMYNEDRVPRSLNFLPAANEMVTHVASDTKYDVSIMMDCGQINRAGKDFPSENRRGKLLCIDHHATGCEEADASCLDNEASSTGEVVYKVLKRLDAEISRDIATLILTTIIVDTGFFRYSNTSSHALELAAELVNKGASTWLISKNMEERVLPAQLNLLALAIETVDYFLDGRLAIMLLTDQMLKRAKGNVEMAEEFINYPRSIEGVYVAALIRELGDNNYKISLRSKDSIDVAALASKFGGGGHEHAAGFSLEAKLGVVKQTVVQVVREAFESEWGGK